MFIKHRKRRLYNRPGETKIRISNAPDMAYYHPFKSCTNLTAGDMWEGKTIVAEDAQKNLSILHKRVLFKEFGMMLNQLKDSCSLNACALLVSGWHNVGKRLIVKWYWQGHQLLQQFVRFFFLFTQEINPESTVVVYNRFVVIPYFVFCIYACRLEEICSK